MKRKNIFKRISKAAVALALSAITFLSASIGVFASVEFAGSSGGSESSDSMSGDYVAYYDSASSSYAVGYRFAVIDNNGYVKPDSIIDVYNSRHDTNKKVIKIGENGGRRKAKQEIIATGI